MTCSKCGYLLDRIKTLKVIIDNYETAIEAVTAGGIQSYTLDTGQTRQTVTRANLKDIEEGLERQLNRLFMLQTRYDNQCGGGASNTLISRPAW